MKMNSRLLFCRCEYAPIVPVDAKRRIRQALEESGLAFDSVPDLCELAAHKDPLLAELAAAPGLAIAACHPRAVQWLFAAGGAPLRDEGVAYFDLRDGGVEPLLGAIANAADFAPGAAAERATVAFPEWRAWFPVIDYARCQGCQQCLGFCLFGVYGVAADGRTEVQHPANCKTGCPACARVCPDGAIVFPKYPNAPINGGQVKEDDPNPEPVQLDKAALVRGDVMAVLKQRTKDGARFCPDAAQVKAVQERLAHLSAAQRPPDVSLGSLTAKPRAKTEPA